ncbi:LAMI_0H00760g1_1 [Lachancea mirantina]|uniref:LAMI_0H00760g1_1 n=1 Tax=Lachancea mirantina TaxID=1230905 RepID=A0A1G4KDN2_9SACH|nr:LAMI_0H00760g1_1 [Lachancea mirantina]
MSSDPRRGKNLLRDLQKNMDPSKTRRPLAPKSVNLSQLHRITKSAKPERQKRYVPQLPLSRVIQSPSTSGRKLEVVHDKEVKRPVRSLGEQARTKGSRLVFIQPSSSARKRRSHLTTPHTSELVYLTLRAVSHLETTRMLQEQHLKIREFDMTMAVKNVLQLPSGGFLVIGSSAGSEDCLSRRSSAVVLHARKGTHVPLEFGKNAKLRFNKSLSMELYSGLLWCLRWELLD